MVDVAEKPSADRVRLAGTIVAAYVASNPLPPGELPALIRSVYDTLRALSGEAPTDVQRTPAVPVRRSVLPDAIVCLECGVRQKMLKRHIKAAHGLEPADYRARWNLPADYPLISSEYSARRSALATSMGLGSQGRGRPKGGGRRGRA